MDESGEVYKVRQATDFGEKQYWKQEKNEKERSGYVGGEYT